MIGSLIGSISAFFGGWVDLIIMRIVDIIYTIPDFLLIVLLSFALRILWQSWHSFPDSDGCRS